VQEAYNNEDCITLTDLYLDLGIPSKMYYQWVKDYEFFEQAHEQARSLIGRRREKNGLKRKFDAGMVSYTMPVYDQLWKEVLELRSSLKEKEKGATAQNITVLMDKVEDSPMVPSRSPEEVVKQSSRQNKHPKYE